MARFIRVSLLLVAAGLFVTTAALANIPDPELSSCPDVLTIVPESEGQPFETYSVTVNGALGPVIGSQVEIIVTALADVLICWCPGSSHPVFSATAGDGTGGSTVGVAEFSILGGGCVLEADLGATVASVEADAVLLCEIDINSPDVVNGAGQKATDPGYEFDPIELDPNAPEDPAVCVVSPSDAVYHTGPIVGALVDRCSRFAAPYDNPVSPGDATAVTPFIVNASSCP